MGGLEGNHAAQMVVKAYPDSRKKKRIENAGAALGPRTVFSERTSLLFFLRPPLSFLELLLYKSHGRYYSFILEHLAFLLRSLIL